MRQRKQRIFLPLLLILGLGYAPGVGGEELEVSRGLSQYFVLVELNISGGRVVAESKHANRRTTSSTTNHATKRSESLSITTTNSRAALQYTNTSPESAWTVEFRDDTVNISRTPKGASDIGPLKFEQKSTGEMLFVVGDQQIRGNTLWHLLIKHPALCRAELLPVLKKFNDDWQLAETAQQVETALVFWAESSAVRPQFAFDELIGDLGDRKFAKRRAAERRLRLLGVRVLPKLEELNLDDLDAEQRVRVRRIIDGLSTPATETPTSIAQRLVADREIWLALLDRPSLATRRVAAAQLAQLLEQEIEFTPEAEEDVRAAQIKALAQLLESP